MKGLGFVMISVYKRVYREELLKALNIYQNELSEFIYRPMSPAMVARMEDKLEHVRRRYQYMDRNPAWDVKIKIVQTGMGSFELTPVLDDVILEDKPRIPF